MPEPITHQLSRPGVTLTYDVRGDVADATPDRPVLVLVGSPMGAAGFTTLASHFTDRPVVRFTRPETSTPHIQRSATAGRVCTAVVCSPPNGTDAYARARRGCA